MTCNDGCCSSGAAVDRKVTSRAEETSIGRISLSDEEKPSPCRDRCCPDTPAKDPLVLMRPVRSPNDYLDDECGPPDYQRVILQVQGMTCTGCESTLVAAIGQLRGVADVRTSFAIARAEFLLDINRITVDEALVRLSKTTSFTFTRVFEENGQTLEVTVDDPAALCLRYKSAGVLNLSVVDEKTARITYNPNVVGARQLLQESFGRPLDLAPLRGDPSSAGRQRRLRKDGLFFASVALLTIPVLIFAWAPLPGDPLVYDIISLVLASFIQIGVAWKFYPPAFKELFFRRAVDVDMLVTLSTTAAYVFSVVSFTLSAIGKPLDSGQFFETSTLLATIVLLSRLISDLARHKAMESVSIRSLQETKALLINKDGNAMEIDSRLLQYNDVFRVPSHSKIVTDGIVTHGTSEIDESMMTGESKTVPKAVGSEVTAGSINGSAPLDVVVTHLPAENTISTIAKLVDEAALSKAPIQDIADKIAGYFVPAMVALTVIVFVIQVLNGVLHVRTRKSPAVDALKYAIATLVVSCPCAIALAVPMVVVIAGGVAATHGVVLKEPRVLEFASNSTHVIFDKTGTITHGEMSVIVAEYLGSFSQSIVESIILGLTKGINHPVSKAVVSYLQDSSDPEDIRAVRTLVGKGVQGMWGDHVVRAGNCHWLNAEANPTVEKLLRTRATGLVVTIDGALVAVFALANPLRPESDTVINTLLAQGLKVSIVSGDEESAVQFIAESLKVPLANVKARCSPADKQKYIMEALGPNQENTVIFCGDGTNDAVALKQATIGIHMSDGTDVAKSAANVVLVRPDLRGILLLLQLAKTSKRRIQFNFAWSIIYNLVAITFAAGAWVKVSLPPEFAALGELVSVLPVIAIAIQLKFVNFRYEKGSM